MLSKGTRYFFGSHSKFAIIGGGTAGLNLSAQLKQAGVLNNHIRVFEPSKTHAYQPAWTLVAGGEFNPANSIKPTKKVFGETQLTELAVQKVNPEENSLTTEDGDTYTYDHVIIATGLKLDYDVIKGATEALNDPNCPIGSAYTKEYAEKFDKVVKNFQGGEMVFHEPQMPIKCAGAPQKVCFLTEHQLRKLGKREQSNLTFFMAKGVVFGVPKYSEVLTQIHKDKNVNINLGQKVVEVQKDTRTIIYENCATGAKSSKKFDALHLVPPQSAPKFIAESGLGDATGFVDVNQGTLQHKKYKNVWALGDSSNCPTSKTAAAVFSQTPVLVHNLNVVAKKKIDPFHVYEGYTSCPIPVGDGKLMLCEFKYGAEVDETFPIDQGKPQTSFYLLKKHFFPQAYWQFVPRGMWHGRRAFLPHIPFLEHFLPAPKKEGHH